MRFGCGFPAMRVCPLARTLGVHRKHALRVCRPQSGYLVTKLWIPAGDAKRVNALIVVAGDEHPGALGDHLVHELDVHGVEILELVDHEMLKIQEADSVQRTGRHLHHALPHDLPGKDAGICLRSWSMERRELTSLGSRDG